MIMNILKGVNNLVKATRLFIYLSYSIFRYKCGFIAFEDAVISICDSFIHENYIFTKVVQWGVQEIYDDANINSYDKLKEYFSTFSNRVPYTQDELKHTTLLINNAIQYARTRNDELVIENENGCDYYIPMNSGSVALVFKARLNGTFVVIKILRSNIRNKIKEDVDILLSIFENTVIKKVMNYYIKLNFKTFISSNVELLLKQCDFSYEIENAQIFKNSFKNKKNIIIPAFYPHFTETFEDIIIMEYLDGPVAKNIPLEHLNKYFKPLQSFFFDSLFRYKILHGDFHLGNIIIMNDGKNIGIIDFGIVYFLTDEISNMLFNLMIISVNLHDMKYLEKNLKIVIEVICSDESQHENILKKIKEDKKLIRMLQSQSKCFSSNILIEIINKIMSLDNVDLNPNMCQLCLSTMSGLQTIEYTNNNSSIEYMLKEYMKKCVAI